MTMLTRHRSLFPTLPTLFDTLFENADGFGPIYASRDMLPAVNVLENKDWYQFDFAVPGMTKKDFHVWTENGDLIVTAERLTDEKEKDDQDRFVRQEFNYSSFRRAFTLPVDADEKRIKARYEDGILKVRIGRHEAKEKVAPQPVNIQ